MKYLKVYVSRQLDGLNFSIFPSTVKAITEQFPEAVPNRHLFISAGEGWDFSQKHGLMQHHILPIITGLESEDLMKMTDVVLFLNSRNLEQLYQLPMSHVKKEQLVLG